MSCGQLGSAYRHYLGTWFLYTGTWGQEHTVQWSGNHLGIYFYVTANLLFSQYCVEVAVQSKAWYGFRVDTVYATSYLPKRHDICPNDMTYLSFISVKNMTHTHFSSCKSVYLMDKAIAIKYFRGFPQQIMQPEKETGREVLVEKNTLVSEQI